MFSFAPIQPPELTLAPLWQEVQVTVQSAIEVMVTRGMGSLAQGAVPCEPWVTPEFLGHSICVLLASQNSLLKTSYAVFGFVCLSNLQTPFSGNASSGSQG